jgi:AcrR family transcriptional regulator
MPESYSELQKKITQESILIALLSLMEKQPFTQITITQIAKVAGVSRMAFYRNHASKEDVIVRHLADLYEEFNEIVRQMKSPDKHGMVTLFFAFFKKKSAFIEKLVESRLAHLFFEQLVNQVAEFFQTHEDKAKDNPAHVRYIAHFTAGGLYSVLLEWIKNNTRESVEEVTQLVMEIT